MKTTVYLRIGKNNKKAEDFRIEASEKPNDAPLKIGNRYIPTVSFGVDFEIPNELFQGAALIVGLLKLTTENTKISTHIKVPKL